MTKIRIFLLKIDDHCRNKKIGCKFGHYLPKNPADHSIFLIFAFSLLLNYEDEKKFLKEFSDAALTKFFRLYNNFSENENIYLNFNKILYSLVEQNVRLSCVTNIIDSPKGPERISEHLANALGAALLDKDPCGLMEKWNSRVRDKTSFLTTYKNVLQTKNIENIWGKLDDVKMGGRTSLINWLLDQNKYKKIFKKNFTEDEIGYIKEDIFGLLKSYEIIDSNFIKLLLNEKDPEPNNEFKKIINEYEEKKKVVDPEGNFEDIVYTQCKNKDVVKCKMENTIYKLCKKTCSNPDYRGEIVQSGGKNSKYYLKYIKYKTKYLRLKNEF